MTTLKEIIISQQAEIPAAAKEFSRLCENHFFFAFYGNLGAGKTTFIKAVCQELGSRDNVTSPTYSLVNEYHTETTVPIYHIDLYRLKNLQEALDIGMEEYFYKEGAYCLVEWPQLAETLFPPDVVKVYISKGAGNERIIRIEKQ